MKYLILYLICLMFVLPVFAQDPTPAATQEATPEPSGVTIINETTQTDPAEPWWAKYAAGGAAVLATILAVFYGGLTALTKILATVNRWLESLKTNESGMHIAEAGYQHAPNRLKAMIVPLVREFVRLGGNVAEIQKEVEDSQPYTPVNASISSTPAPDTTTLTSPTDTPR